MIEVKKTIGDYGYNYASFHFLTEEGEFEIFYCNVGDLYWKYNCKKSILDEPDTKTFKITKENEFVYSLFNELYTAVKDKKIYKTYPDSFDVNHNQKLKYYGGYPLFVNDKIIWYSDDADEEIASSFQIAKEDNGYALTFTKSGEDEWIITYSVRIRTSGSRYQQLYLPFMGMYQKLKEHDFSQDKKENNVKKRVLKK